MGPALSEIFSEAGVQLYSESVLAIKEQLQDIFTTAIGGLEGTIKEELGRRGQAESAAHFGPWIASLVEDVVQFGMPEIGGALEDLAGSLTAEFVQEETETGEELLGLEEEEPVEGEEEVEVIEEEPVEEPAAEEEPGLEELMAPAEEEVPEEEAEAEASTEPLKPRTFRIKVPRHKRLAHATKHVTVELKDLFRAAGGRVAIKRKAKTATAAKKVLAKVQEHVVKQLAVRFGAVTEVDPQAIEAWVKKAYAIKE
jgi:hypothetical protein